MIVTSDYEEQGLRGFRVPRKQHGCTRLARATNLLVWVIEYRSRNSWGRNAVESSSEFDRPSPRKKWRAANFRPRWWHRESRTRNLLKSSNVLVLSDHFSLLFLIITYLDRRSVFFDFLIHRFSDSLSWYFVCGSPLEWLLTLLNKILNQLSIFIKIVENGKFL